MESYFLVDSSWHSGGGVLICWSSLLYREGDARGAKLFFIVGWETGNDLRFFSLNYAERLGLGTGR